VFCYECVFSLLVGAEAAAAAGGQASAMDPGAAPVPPSSGFGSSETPGFSEPPPGGFADDSESFKWDTGSGGSGALIMKAAGGLGTLGVGVGVMVRRLGAVGPAGRVVGHDLWRVRMVYCMQLAVLLPTPVPWLLHLSLQQICVGCGLHIVCRQRSMLRSCAWTRLAGTAAGRFRSHL